MKEKGLRVLVVGGGGREHALAWKVARSPRVGEVWAAPGNPGIAAIARTAPIAADDIRALRQLALDEGIDLTVVGPEGPLADGIVDAFEHAELRIFGPSQAAAQIEASKLWAKDLMDRYGIPTARWTTAEHAEQAWAQAKEFGLPVVLKADGLAGGKGAVVCRTSDQVRQTIEDFMVKSVHGAAGRRMVIEEFLEGQELSVFALADGSQVLPLISARDYKPLLDDDQGPNTGGMGGYARPAYATPALMDEVRQRILEPTVSAMAVEGTPYVGVLYAGLMITPHGPRVLEFNCRWGDPEAQLIMPLLQTDLVELMDTCLEGTLAKTHVSWDQGTSLGVTLAAAGYPSSPRKGNAISGLDALDDGVLAFHAATRKASANGIPAQTASINSQSSALGPQPFVTDGGRVLTVVAQGRTLAEARDRAYANVARIRFEGMQYRRDVGEAEAQQTSAAQPFPTPPLRVSRESGPRARQSGPPRGRESVAAAPSARAAGALGPAVAILMGSESDRAVMDETAKVLATLGITHEVHVMSAHRMPERVREFARGAEARGVRVVIAGAGGAAHLPGVIAAQTTLPVIGVPIAGTALLGLDSLLSIVQMPAGVPVATVAVGPGGARNAAYLAAAILGLGDDDVRARYREFRVKQSGGELA